MKKNLFAIALVVLMLFGFSTLALAESAPSTDPRVDAMIAATNAKVDAMIAKAQLDADLAMQTLSGQKLEARLDRIVNKLQRESYNEVTRLINKAARLGVTVEREWQTVQIGNRSVLVDPAKSVQY